VVDPAKFSFEPFELLNRGGISIRPHADLGYQGLNFPVKSLKIVVIGHRPPPLVLVHATQELVERP